MDLRMWKQHSKSKMQRFPCSRHEGVFGKWRYILPSRLFPEGLSLAIPRRGLGSGLSGCEDSVILRHGVACVVSKRRDPISQ